MGIDIRNEKNDGDHGATDTDTDLYEAPNQPVQQRAPTATTPMVCLAMLGRINLLMGKKTR